MQRPTEFVGLNPPGSRNTRSAETNPVQIVGADRLSHAIVVQFNDGVCAMYPVELLRSLIPRLDASAIETLSH